MRLRDGASHLAVTCASQGGNTVPQGGRYASCLPHTHSHSPHRAERALIFAESKSQHFNTGFQAHSQEELVYELLPIYY